MSHFPVPLSTDHPNIIICLACECALVDYFARDELAETCKQTTRIFVAAGCCETLSSTENEQENAEDEIWINIFKYDLLMKTNLIQFLFHLMCRSSLSES